MAEVKRLFQHLFNPLHVFCRLRAAGMRREGALRLCRIYERHVYRHLSPPRAV